MIIKPIEVNQEKASIIIENRNPLGLFYLKDRERYIGIDNSSGESFVEEFIDKETCIAWLTNSSVNYHTNLDYGKRVDELVVEESNNTTYEVVVKETLVKSVTVNAKSEQEAVSKVETIYDKEKIVLDWNDFNEVKFTATKL